MGNASISACLIPEPQNAGFALTLIAEHAQKYQEFLPTNRQRQISQPRDVYTCTQVQIRQQFLTYFFFNLCNGITHRVLKGKQVGKKAQKQVKLQKYNPSKLMFLKNGFRGSQMNNESTS